MSDSAPPSARTRARELIVQSLYQMQLTGHDKRELSTQFRERPEYERVDQAYFDSTLEGIMNDGESLERDIDEIADRPLAQLDPVERGILLLGFYELRSLPDVPYKVVINEAVNLARKFGAVDGHKYINALLDRAAGKMRPKNRG